MQTQEGLAIEVIGLHQTFSTFTLHLPKLRVQAGELVGIIGENGAGKTTLLRLLLGLEHVNEGNIRLLGERSLTTIKEKIGVVLDKNVYPEILTGQELSQMMSAIYRFTWDKDYFQHLLQIFNLPLKQKVHQLSQGMKMKLNIAVALAHFPDLLIFDESTSHLDPIVRRDIHKVLMDYCEKNDSTLLFSSHLVLELEEFCGRFLCLDHGKILFDMTTDQLHHSYAILTYPHAVSPPEDYLSMLKKGAESYYLIKASHPLAHSDAGRLGVSLEEVLYFLKRGEVANNERAITT